MAGMGNQLPCFAFELIGAQEIDQEKQLWVHKVQNRYPEQSGRRSFEVELATKSRRSARVLM